MAAETTDSSSSGDGGFDKTHWTVILDAGDPSSPNHRLAKEQFCQGYWRPVYVFVRNRGKSPHDAEDLTQAFFAQLFEKNKLARLKREGGRFRAWLRKLLKNFLIQKWHEANSLKHGGGKVHISFDEATETQYLKALSQEATPDAQFDRQYAIAVVDQVLRRLRAEETAKGKAEAFECLEGCLPGSTKPVSYGVAAQALGLSEDAVKMAVNRLRKRLRRLLRQEVAASGTPAEEVTEEIRYLLEVLSRE